MQVCAGVFSNVFFLLIITTYYYDYFNQNADHETLPQLPILRNKKVCFFVLFIHLYSPNLSAPNLINRSFFHFYIVTNVYSLDPYAQEAK